MKDGEIRIAQVGTFDLDNLGDLLFPFIFSKLLDRILGKGSYSLELFGPIGCAKGAFYSDHSLVRPISLLQDSCIDGSLSHVFVGGGDLLRCDDWSLHSVYGQDSGAAFTRIISPLGSAKAKLHLLAVGAPFPIDSSFEVFLRNNFSRFSSLSVRDNQTRNKIESFAPSTKLVPDLVCCISTVIPLSEYPAAETLIESRSGYFVFHGSRFVLTENDIEPFARLLFDLEENLGLTPVFLEIGAAIGDVETGKALVSRLEAFGSSARYVRKNSMLEMCGVLAHCQFYLGSSMHGSIVASSYGRPVVSYVGEYSTKVASFYAQLDRGLLFRTPNELCAESKAVLSFIEGCALMQPAPNHKAAMVENHVRECLSSTEICGSYNSDIDLVFISQRETLSRVIYESDARLKAEQENAEAQISYRDKLVAELESLLEAEKRNAIEQIGYRDALILELQSRDQSEGSV